MDPRQRSFVVGMLTVASAATQACAGGHGHDARDGHVGGRLQARGLGKRGRSPRRQLLGALQDERYVA